MSLLQKIIRRIEKSNNSTNSITDQSSFNPSFNISSNFELYNGMLLELKKQHGNSKTDRIMNIYDSVSCQIVGEYTLFSYYNNNIMQDKRQNRTDEFYLEVGYIHVFPEFRGMHIGSIITAIGTLDAIIYGKPEHLKFTAINPKIVHILDNMKFVSKVEDDTLEGSICKNIYVINISQDNKNQIINEFETYLKKYAIIKNKA
jgi:hypothetical protein